MTNKTKIFLCITSFHATFFCLISISIFLGQIYDHPLLNLIRLAEIYIYIFFSYYMALRFNIGSYHE
jgi:hypothetical protein